MPARRQVAGALLQPALRAGTVGALAMVPVGGLLRRAGYDVNEYGEAVVETAFGTPPAVIEVVLLLGLHLGVSIGAAIPLVVLLERAGTRLPALALGLGYGAGWWALVNSLLLPALYGRRTPWTIGVADIWPSLLVHLVFGAAVAVTFTRAARRAAGREDEPARAR